MGYSLGYGFGHTWKRKKRAGAVAPSAVGGAGLLVGEANGFGTDFLYATDASRVAVKVTNVTTNYAINSFYTNAGTSAKMVYLPERQHNLIKYSSNFENAVWSTDAGSWTTPPAVTANATAAPNGAMEADKFGAGMQGPNIGGWIYQTMAAMPAGGTYSIYAKAAECSFLFVQSWEEMTGNGFDLINGTVHPKTGFATANGVIQAVGSGWYRCSINFGPLCTGPMPQLMGAIDDFQVSAVGHGVYLWGAQVNEGTAATSYVATTATAVDAGWLGWSPHNLLVQSNDFTTGWTAIGLHKGEERPWSARSQYRPYPDDERRHYE